MVWNTNFFLFSFIFPRGECKHVRICVNIFVNHVEKCGKRGNSQHLQLKYALFCHKSVFWISVLVQLRPGNDLTVFFTSNFCPYLWNSDVLNLICELRTFGLKLVPLLYRKHGKLYQKTIRSIEYTTKFFGTVLNWDWGTNFPVS